MCDRNVMLADAHGTHEPVSARARDYAAKIADRRTGKLAAWLPDSPLAMPEYVLTHPHPDPIAHIDDLLDALRLTVDLRELRRLEWLELIELGRLLGARWADLAEPMGAKPDSKKHALNAAARGTPPRSGRHEGQAARSAHWAEEVLARRMRQEERTGHPCGVAAFPDRAAGVPAFVLSYRVHPAILVQDVADALRIAAGEYHGAELQWFRLAHRARNLGDDTVTWTRLAEPMGCSPGSRSAAEVAFRRTEAALDAVRHGLRPRRERASASAQREQVRSAGRWADSEGARVLKAARALVAHEQQYAAAGIDLVWIEDIIETLESGTPDAATLGLLVSLAADEATAFFDADTPVTCSDSAMRALESARIVSMLRRTASGSTNC